jgi:hypothetical protein
MRLFKRRILRLRRNWFRVLISTFLIYSGLWTILESLSFLFSWLRPEGLGAFLPMAGVGLCVSAVRELPPLQTKLRNSSIDAMVTVKFGDLFDSQGYKVVPVNEFFDSQIGDHVSPLSIHGQLIERFFGGQAEPFEVLVDSSLQGEKFRSFTRANGREKCYPIGTTPKVRIGDEVFFLLALTHTDLLTLKASCDVPTLWEALMGLWRSVRNGAGGAPVAVPLIGGGLASIGLPPSQLLQLILLSITSASKESPIGSPIHIVLSEKYFEEIDLQGLNEYWS